MLNAAQRTSFSLTQTVGARSCRATVAILRKVLSAESYETSKSLQTNFGDSYNLDHLQSEITD